MDTTIANPKVDVSLRLRELQQAKTTSPTPTFSKSLRRKRSFSFQSDSSEECSSPHDSIYEAVYISPLGSEENIHKIHLITIPPRKKPTPSKSNRGNDENRKELPTAISTPAPAPVPTPAPVIEDAEFLYGHGTPLETITEQKSYTTMRSLVESKSADDLSSFPFVRHRDSFMLAKSPRRKQSFSVDDITFINKTYHDACAMIERETHMPLPIYEVYAEPMAPTHAPPKRPGTPPGMPSWTAAQTRPRLQVLGEQSTQNRVQRWFGLPSSENAHSSRVSSSSSYRTISFPGPVAPKFRPPKSAYGPLEQHPFVKAQTFQVAGPSRPADSHDTVGLSRKSLEQANFRRHKAKSRIGQRVRFTQGATNSGSEMLSLRAATDVSAHNGVQLANANPVQAVHHHYNYPKQKQCPHRKGRRAALKALNYNQARLNEISLTPNAYSPSRLSTSSHPSSASSPSHLISSLSSRPLSLNEQDSCVTNLHRTSSLSTSSTAHLMSGAIDPSLQVNLERNLKVESCWKCKIDAVFDKVDQLWVRSASCLCFVCCGFDMDEGLTRPHDCARGGSGYSPNSARMRGGWFEGDPAPRVVYNQETPVEMV